MMRWFLLCHDSVWIGIDHMFYDFTAAVVTLLFVRGRGLVSAAVHGRGAATRGLAVTEMFVGGNGNASGGVIEGWAVQGCGGEGAGWTSR